MLPMKVEFYRCYVCKKLYDTKQEAGECCMDPDIIDAEWQETTAMQKRPLHGQTTNIVCCLHKQKSATNG